MKPYTAALALSVSLVSAVLAQQPAAAPAGASTPVPQPPIIIYRIDLVPTGSTFAMNEPVLEGDTYVYTSLPEREVTRIPKVKVKSVARWSGDWSKEVVWRVELVGSSGMHLVRDEPVKKGKNYVAHIFKNGTLVSVPESDVLKITRLTGRDAFRAEQIALGLIVLEGESMTPGFQGGNSAVNVPTPSGPPGGAPPGDGNWTYQGQPGATDAYAPAGGTVAKPGDTPMVPTPQ
jgi:hypothetical protein